MFKGLELNKVKAANHSSIQALIEVSWRP